MSLCQPPCFGPDDESKLMAVRELALPVHATGAKGACVACAGRRWISIALRSVIAEPPIEPCGKAVTASPRATAL